MRRNLFLAVKETLNNALRHSGASELELCVEWRRGWLRVVITDNGKGFSPGAVSSSGNGLRNLPLRAKEAGGRFDLRSAPGEGTTAEFLLPLAARTRLGGRG